MGWVRRRCRATGAARCLPGSEGTGRHAGAAMTERRRDGCPPAPTMLRMCSGCARDGRGGAGGEPVPGNDDAVWRGAACGGGLAVRIPRGRVVRLPGRTLRGAMARLCPDADKHARCAGVCAFTGRGAAWRAGRLRPDAPWRPVAQGGTGGAAWPIRPFTRRSLAIRSPAVLRRVSGCPSPFRCYPSCPSCGLAMRSGSTAASNAAPSSNCISRQASRRVMPCAWARCAACAARS